MSLPFRPRLAESAMLRRHLVDGVEKLVVHDSARAEVLELSEAQLAQLLACDGTRDLGGVVLACVRAGAYRRIAELEALLGELAARGALADGIEARFEEPDEEPRPLEVLPDFRLRCDGNGSCCTTFSSIAFTSDDAERAVAARPEALGGAPRDRYFLPLYGAVAGGLYAVTMVDGRCGFLEEDGRCGIHAALGFAAKPRGCRMFPATYCDDGVAVRVSVMLECACVLGSIDQVDGDPLVPPGAATAADLPEGVRVARMPAEVPVAAGRTASPREVRAWSEAVLERAAELSDPLSALWALADAASEAGLSIDAARRALDEVATPDPNAWMLRLLALSGRAGDKRRSAQWRSPHDRARRLAEWLDEGAQALLDPEVVRARLGDAERWLAHERFYLRATLFGHGLAKGELTLAQALRDAATRLLLARQLPERVVPSCEGDPARRAPLAAVEAMMRGQGLAAYALDLP